MENNVETKKQYGSVVTEYKHPFRKLPTYTLKKKNKPLPKPGFVIKISIVLILFAALLAFVLWAFSTNPYHPLGKFPKKITLKTNSKGEYEVVSTISIKAKMDKFSQMLAYAKSGFHILVQSAFLSDRKYKGTYEEIRDDIYKERFNPQKPYLIAGDHFSVLYPRNLGVFYNSILNKRTFVNAKDWKNRQEIYINSIFFALESFNSCGGLFTTIVPVSEDTVTCIQVYAYPSDSLYSVLYALRVLESQNETKKIAQFFKSKYSETITSLYKQYQETIVDPKTNLPKKGVHFSGTKDITRHDRSFYDSVMIWKTESLMQDLGFVKNDPVKLIKQKQMILNTYWDKDSGYFLEDLSEQSIKEKYYSSDWLVVLFTGFLDPENKADRNYYLSVYKYIKKVELDKPFGLAYHKDPRRGRQEPIVRLVANEYGATAIWSFWGSQYAKMLGLLCKQDQIGNVCSDYEKQIGLYEDNVVRFGGYSEVYDKHGEIFDRPFYRSMLHTGWIIDLEDARQILKK